MDAVSNFGYSTVSVAPSPTTSGTSLTVTTNSGWPTPPFNAVVWPANTQPLVANAEIVRVTANASGVFTITRAQESTSAIAIVVGYQIANAITALLLTQAGALQAEYPTQRTVASGTTDAGPASMANNCLVLWNSATGGAKTQTIPTSTGTGNKVTIVDVAGTAGAGNITTTPATGSINGAGTYSTGLIYTNFSSITLVDSSAGWVKT